MSDGKGRWKKFPFYYTLLSLSGIELSSAKSELNYAAPVLERLIKRVNNNDKFEIRRKLLIHSILEQYE